MSPFNPSISLNSVDNRLGVDLCVRGSGAVHVIIGPMFSGKTTALLSRKVAMVKSSKDNRYATDSVVTHDGARFPCWALPTLSSFKENFGADAYDKLDVIGIYEAQFFEDLYEFCSEVADHDGKTVIVAGLDGDYLRRSFGSVLDVIPIADSVTKLIARCEQCGQRAFFTLRKTEATETELNGGKDVYMPVCRLHYLKGQAVMEDERTALVSGFCKSHKDNTHMDSRLDLLKFSSVRIRHVFREN